MRAFFILLFASSVCYGQTHKEGFVFVDVDELTITTLNLTSIDYYVTSNPLEIEIEDTRRAPAGQGVNVKVCILHASNDGSGIDPSIGYEQLKQLKQPPFSTYSSYQLVSNNSVILNKSDIVRLKLPNKGSLNLKLLDLSGSNSIKIKAIMVKANGKVWEQQVIHGKKNETVYFMGPKHKKGILVFGIII